MAQNASTIIHKTRIIPLPADAKRRAQNPANKGRNTYKKSFLQASRMVGRRSSVDFEIPKKHGNNNDSDRKANTNLCRQRRFHVPLAAQRPRMSIPPPPHARLHKDTESLPTGRCKCSRRAKKPLYSFLDAKVINSFCNWVATSRRMDKMFKEKPLSAENDHIRTIEMPPWGNIWFVWFSQRAYMAFPNRLNRLAK